MIIPENYETSPYHDPQKVLDDCIRWQAGDMSAPIHYYMVNLITDTTDPHSLDGLDLYTFIQICKAYCRLELLPHVIEANKVS
jgi:hypothetical protein